MVRLAVEFLTKGDEMKERDIGRLEVLIGDYRRASLRQYAMGFGLITSPALLSPESGVQSLI